VVAGRDPRLERSGGHSSYVRVLGRSLLEAGFAVRLVCAGASSDTAVTPEGEIARVRCPWRYPRQIYAPWLERGLAAMLERRSEGLPGPVLFHAVSLWGGAAVRAARGLRRRGRRAIALVSSYATYAEQARSHLLGLRDPRAALSARSRLRIRLEQLWTALVCDRYERRLYRAADAVIVHYDSVARMIARDHGPRVRCRRLPYCTAMAFDDRPPTPVPAADDPLIVSVSRADPRKANDLLLHALRLLREGGLRFSAVVIGAGSLLSDQRALIDRLGLSDRVSAPGVVTDVGPRLERASIFVHSVRAEQSGSLAILEAMQRGRPIVATGVDGILEDLTHETDALLVPPGDVPALAAAIERLLVDSTLRERLARAARATFERRFSAPPFVAALRGLYDEFGVRP
jgi:glycosyltransferase involved in cell wall biosynthesis